MLKIWGRATSSNVQKVLWTCDELGVAFERVDLGGPFGGNQDPDYLKMNPNGLVPTVRDGELVMWESNTICRYLATRHGGERLYPADPAARTHVERWMDWQLAGLGGSMGVMLMGLYRTRPEQRDPNAIETARRRAAVSWAILDGELADQPYLAGDALTLAEIALGTLVYRWHSFPIERPSLPNLKRWYDRLCENDGFKKHIEIAIS